MCVSHSQHSVLHGQSISALAGLSGGHLLHARHALRVGSREGSGPGWSRPMCPLVVRCVAVVWCVMRVASLSTPAVLAEDVSGLGFA